MRSIRPASAAIPLPQWMGKRRELNRLGSDMTSRQTRGELTEQLGCPGRNNEHAHGVGWALP